MNKILQEIIEERLKELFPAGVPKEVNDRAKRELSLIKKRKCEDIWRIYHEFCEVARSDHSIISARATTGNSLITYLLGDSPINPLPAYYYCDHCGQFELIEDHKFGIDAPAKECRECKAVMKADGFGLPEIFTFGTEEKPKNWKFEYDVPADLIPLLTQKIKELYDENEVILWKDRRIGESIPSSDNMIGYAILPKGKNLEKDFSEFLRHDSQGEITIGGDVSRFYEAGIMTILVYVHPVLDKIVELQQKTGMYAADVTLEDLKGFKLSEFLNLGALSEEENMVLSGQKITSAYRLSEALSSVYNTCSENTHRSFFTRESLYEKLLADGIQPEAAYKIVDHVRKGKAWRDPKRWKEICEEMNIPGDIARDSATYKYLYPRVFALDRLWKYSLLLLYSKRYPEVYFANL